MKGENIFKRKDGRWEARYVKNRSPSGQIIYGFCYGKSYKEVKEKVTRFKSTEPKMANIPSTAGRKKFADFCDEWLESCRGRLKASTCERYRTAVERHIKPNLGDCLPQSITSEMVAEFSSIMLNEGLSPKTVKDVLIVLRLVLKYTSKQLPFGLPEIEITYPKEQKKEVRVLQAERDSALLVFARTVEGQTVTVCLNAGAAPAALPSCAGAIAWSEGLDGGTLDGFGFAVFVDGAG